MTNTLEEFMIAGVQKINSVMNENMAPTVKAELIREEMVKMNKIVLQVIKAYEGKVYLN